MKRRRILALSFFPAYVPPGNGGVQRLYQLYLHLAARFDITLISSGEVGGERSIVAHGPGFQEIRVPKDSHFQSCYMDLARSCGKGDLSGPALGESNARFGPLHEEYLAHYAEADFIVHDSPFLVECDLFRGFDNKLRIYNSYNWETGLYRSFHSLKGISTRIEELVERLERDLCENADLITVCAGEDARAFKEAFSPAAPIIISPNGVVPISLDKNDKRTPNTLVFLGSGHQPNVDAARRIVEEIAPACPHLQFHLIGSSWPAGAQKNVTAHGQVSSSVKTELLKSAQAAINPVLSGSGSSLKIADIAAHGTPLISTALGVRGFDFSAGEHYLVFDPDMPSQCLNEALANPSALVAMSERARTHVTSRFAWSRIAQEFGDQLETLKPLHARAQPVLVINDYDSLGSIGGGATRTRGLCEGLAETQPVIVLAFTNDDQSCRQMSPDRRILSLLVAKTAEHQAEHTAENTSFWVSTADIVNYRYALRNGLMTELFRCAAEFSTNIICEHPYLVCLPRAFDAPFVYSSQNYEAGLKAESLRHHPKASELLVAVREAEQYACGAADFIVAVSDADARSLGATYRFTAPILVIPNGAEGPYAGSETGLAGGPKDRPQAVFMGSTHGPNLQAARWIVKELAPAMSEFEFVFLGSAASDMLVGLPENVTILGQVSAQEKSRRLTQAAIALNPMDSGSGSNIKVADYLQHGLLVVSTLFGARGYDWVPSDDLHRVELQQFPAALRALLHSPELNAEARCNRMLRYRESLSMVEGGRQLARLLDAHSSDRRRALYVTYRYSEPNRGGGEAYVVKLVDALAASGWSVDVASPAAEHIVDVNRFGAAFTGDHEQPVPIGKPRVRSAKFALDAPAPDKASIARIWESQAEFEAAAIRKLPEPSRSCLAWGWADPGSNERWCFRRAGLFAHAPSALRLAGFASSATWLQLFDGEDALLKDVVVDGEFFLLCEVPQGFCEIRVEPKMPVSNADPRPLGLLVREVELGEINLINDRALDLLRSANEPKEIIEAFDHARRVARDVRGLNLTHLRDPSSSLNEFVAANVGEYDLLITHNAVFGCTTAALASAKRAGVPSVFLPHLHHDDDFYHFSDVHEACASATRTLVCPEVSRLALTNAGLGNVLYHAPGVQTSVQFQTADAAAFRALLGEQGDFFLILGRKAAAKNYREVIDAAKVLGASARARVVLIGPDDDGVPVDPQAAIYLGRQSDEIVRGALMECTALINMSSSESFGMVLLEAGLAGKPVLANRHCAAFGDIVKDGVNGFLVDPLQLPEYMASLLANRELCETLGTNGQRMARDHDWGTVEKSFVEICNELVEASQ